MNSNELFFYTPQATKKAVRVGRDGKPYVAVVEDTRAAGRMTIIGIVNDNNTITLGKSQVNNRLEPGQKRDLFNKAEGRRLARENAQTSPIAVKEFTDRKAVGKLFTQLAKQLSKE